MKIAFFTTSALCLGLLTSQAFAAGVGTAQHSKGEDAAAFRLKVASCRAQAKTDAVKPTSSAFYTYMAGCIDKVQVTWNVASTAPLGAVPAEAPAK